MLGHEQLTYQMTTVVVLFATSVQYLDLEQLFHVFHLTLNTRPQLYCLQSTTTNYFFFSFASLRYLKNYDYPKCCQKQDRFQR